MLPLPQQLFVFQLKLISAKKACHIISPLCLPRSVFAKFVTRGDGSLTSPPLNYVGCWLTASRWVTSWTASSGSQTLTVWSSAGHPDSLKQDQNNYFKTRSGLLSSRTMRPRNPETFNNNSFIIRVGNHVDRCCHV